MESERMPSITRAGSLREVAETNGYSANWIGGISLDTRTDVTRPNIERFLETELDKYYIAADMRSPFRCIDGRPNEGTEDKVRAGKMERTVAPQIAGGTAGCALAARAIEGSHMNGTTFAQDVETTVKNMAVKGIRFGGHIDDHQHGDNCGCGAIDKIPEIFDIVANEEAFRQVKNITKAILGTNYDDATAMRLLGNFERMHANRDEYLERNGDSYPYKRKWVAIMQEHAADAFQKIQKMVGKHNEVALVVNTVEGTTLNRARLNVDTDRKMQVFNLDYWACVQIAKKLYPQSPEKQHDWLHARIMLTAATAMALTDGSLEVAVRK